jgi:NTP pyrophosphatase (non-canonical NTP hydrolase)
MTPNEYMKLALRTNKDMGKKNNMIHAAMLLSSEGGEVMTEVKRMFAYGKEVDTHNVKAELGDILWGIALMCDTLGFTLEDVMETNIAKLEARYPDLRFNADHAINRDTDKEQAAMGAK